MIKIEKIFSDTKTRLVFITIISLIIGATAFNHFKYSSTNLFVEMKSLPNIEIKKLLSSYIWRRLGLGPKEGGRRIEEKKAAYIKMACKALKP